MREFLKIVLQVWKEKRSEKKTRKTLLRHPLNYELLEKMICASGKDLEIQINRPDNTVIFIRKRTDPGKDPFHYYK